MALDLPHLNQETRDVMLVEIRADCSANKLTQSKRFSAGGKSDYEGLLLICVEKFDEVWLQSELNKNERMATHEPRKTAKGTIQVRVPPTAAQTMSEGEFNRFYIRSLCVQAIELGILFLVVYRAKGVENPRIESEKLIGTYVDPVKLLDDLRENVGVDTALGLPAGPNSGISVRFPKSEEI